MLNLLRQGWRLRTRIALSLLPTRFYISIVPLCLLNKLFNLLINKLIM